MSGAKDSDESGFDDEEISEDVLSEESFLTDPEEEVAATTPEVELLNDGPVTIWIDSKNKE